MFKINPMKKPKISFNTIVKNKKLEDFKEKFEMEIMDDESVADK